MNNKTLRLGLLIILLVAITMSIIAGTLAKYVESVTATDSARVAKFEYELSGIDNNTQTINLFDTANDTGILSNLKNDSKKLIAPGTDGSLTVKLTNKSEVAISAGFTLTETNDNDIPIVYGYNGKYYSSVIPTGTSVTVHSGEQAITVEGDLTALATAVGNAESVKQNLSKDISLTWAWAFEGDGTTQTDVTDTTLGNAGTATVQLQVKCDVTQID